MNKLLGRVIRERRIYFTTDDQTSYARLTPLRQIGLGLMATSILGWSAVSGVLLAADALAPAATNTAVVVQGVQQNRIDELMEERARFAAEAEEARVRLVRAAEVMGAQQQELVTLHARLGETESAVEEQRVTLEARQMDLVEREEALSDALVELAALDADLTERSDKAEDMSRSVAILLDGLSRTADDRDGMADEMARMASEHAELEARAILAEQRQERVIARLENAVEGGIAALDEVFRAAGADVASLFPQGPGYDGQGGPNLDVETSVELPEAANGAAEAADLAQEARAVDPTADRVDLLLNRISDLNARRAALGQMPFAGPVRAAYRQTSPFGTRRDPINGGRRQHNGLDFAAPVGTPLHATGAGEVVYAGRRGAFGNLVKIRHAFGYETLYAHMHRIDVAVGDRVEAGDMIGQMGSTGRSTGSHLHYEVHLHGAPVDPMTYLKAAENVL
ncbi:DUF5930 domain-containing protein [Roseobacter sp. HKCCA0434]|uniref:DUF5930 domain-containing protein n=1 Tax=Roseobacter sp. HKCCA0434 TaxID=3079297 RepID=UPI002905B272|nr:DUF5930 domain-containing protein [Roseobacter sp. HKCCA0434]